MKEINKFKGIIVKGDLNYKVTYSKKESSQLIIKDFNRQAVNLDEIVQNIRTNLPKVNNYVKNQRFYWRWAQSSWIPCWAHVSEGDRSDRGDSHLQNIKLWPEVSGRLWRAKPYLSCFSCLPSSLFLGVSSLRSSPLRLARHYSRVMVDPGEFSTKCNLKPT